MPDYLHHVPGRLRIRSRAFRADPVLRGAMLRKLRALEGVRSVRLNEKAASVTVSYDVGSTGPEAIVDFVRIEYLQSTPRAAGAFRAGKAPDILPEALTAEISKVALSMLINKGVSYSLSSLLGARI